jgi:glyoxylase-like metal-dependent hydrolase (beta-lactamase superfamily II)
MLIDAGDLDIPRALEKWRRTYLATLNVKPVFPNDRKSTGEWTLDYIQHFWPNKAASSSTVDALDYVLITHFHADHVGDGRKPSAPNSTLGTFLQTGIAEIW